MNTGQQHLHNICTFLLTVALWFGTVCSCLNVSCTIHSFIVDGIFCCMHIRHGDSTMVCCRNCDTVVQQREWNHQGRCNREKLPRKHQQTVTKPTANLNFSDILLQICLDFCFVCSSISAISSKLSAFTSWPTRYRLREYYSKTRWRRKSDTIDATVDFIFNSTTPQISWFMVNN